LQFFLKIRKKVQKPGHVEQKRSKNLQNSAKFFYHQSRFSLAVTNRLKLKKKWKRAFQWDCFSFQKMYLWPLTTVWFSQSWHFMERQIGDRVVRQYIVDLWSYIYICEFCAVLRLTSFSFAFGLSACITSPHTPPW